MAKYCVKAATTIRGARRFIADQKFAPNSAGITEIREGFKHHFSGLIETKVPQIVASLRQGYDGLPGDVQLFQELGGDAALITLAHLYALLSSTRRFNLREGMVRQAFVRDHSGIVCAVHFSWSTYNRDQPGWHINAQPITAMTEESARRRRAYGSCFDFVTPHVELASDSYVPLHMRPGSPLKVVDSREIFSLIGGRR